MRQPLPNSNQRKHVVDAALSLLEAGLVVGTAGNVSVRETGARGFLITPSAMDYRVIKEKDIVRIDLETGTAEGRRLPSSECGLHIQIYRKRGDVNAVIHHHSPYATAVAVARKTIPNILDEGVDLTPIPTVEYAPSVSTELAAKAAAKLAEGSNVVLLANHGVVVVGENLEEALGRSVEVERLAQIFVWAEALGGAVSLEEGSTAKSRQSLKEYKAAKTREDRLHLRAGWLGPKQ